MSNAATRSWTRASVPIESTAPAASLASGSRTWISFINYRTPDFVTVAQFAQRGRAPLPQTYSALDIWSRVVVDLNRSILAAERPVSEQVVSEALRLLKRLIFDDSPTPQIAIDETGAIEVVWLVNGQTLVLAVEPNAVAEIWALNAQGREIFSGLAYLSPEVVNESIFSRAIQYLNYLSPEVRTRAWHAQQ